MDLGVKEKGDSAGQNCCEVQDRDKWERRGNGDGDSAEGSSIRGSGQGKWGYGGRGHRQG